MNAPAENPESNPAVAWEQIQSSVQTLRQEVGRVIVGQDQVVEHMLVALCCQGHCLLVGVPGLAKTLLVSTLGKILGLAFKRIQFTPDLMPTDILGSEILQTEQDSGRREFEFVRGPIFANLILADEINRTPPKTQAALLEAMQEKQVTVAGRSMPLERPFIVFATQNPIEQEGTYPLPEAQQDRFFLHLVIDYPSLDEERLVVQRTAGDALPTPEPVFGREDLARLQQAVHQVPLPDHLLDHILRLVHSTRPNSDLADDYVRKYVAWGAGPRASQTFAHAARALALLRGQAAASVDEVRDLALPVLRHRIVPNYNATGEGVREEDIIQHVIDAAR